MHQTLLGMVASSNNEEPILAVIAFFIACWLIYFRMDRSDKDHEIKIKKLNQKKKK